MKALEIEKQLIKNSEYCKYSRQAKEFMKLFHGDKFSQTDVLRAYEQFEAWCLNKNLMQVYNYEVAGDFMLDRDEKDESSYHKLV